MFFIGLIILKTQRENRKVFCSIDLKKRGAVIFSQMIYVISDQLPNTGISDQPAEDQELFLHLVQIGVVFW